MKFFISHSSKNAEIAILLSNYLQAVISDSEVFCSSLPDTFDSGDDYNPKIMNSISEADCFIPILTDDFYRSRYCLIELGYACGILFSKGFANTISPFSLPPIKPGEALKNTPLESRLTVGILNNSEQIKKFFKKHLVGKPLPTNFNKTMDSFIKELDSIGKNMDSELFEIAKNYVDPILLPYINQGFFWGQNISVVPCPNNRDWWTTTDLKFRKLNTYDLTELCSRDSDLKSDEVIAQYDEYLKNEFPQKYTKNKKRFMLANRYYSTIDNSGVILELRETNWSVFRFFAEKVLTEDKIKKYIDDCFASSKIFFPNSLCLHLVILTDNNKILITEIQASNNSDVTNCWAVSIGEQIDEADLEDMESDIAAKWVKRALREEAGLTIDEGHYKLEDIKFMSINLEANIVNFTACCVVRLRISDSELTRVLQDFSKHRDKEIKVFGFMDIDEVPNELISQSREYHPSSQLRMAYAYIYANNSKTLKEELNKRLRKL